MKWGVLTNSEKKNNPIQSLPQRKSQTTPPQLDQLWMFFKGTQMCGYDFNRQKPLDEYIVDFFCNELKLAIEYDGISHGGRKKYDERKRRKLESIGIRFLRFNDNDVYYSTEKVLGEIE